MVKDLNVGYDLAHVFHDVSFTVARGEIVALLGRNGVGKTTTLCSLVGLTLPYRQSDICLVGKPIAKQASEAIAVLGVSYVFDDCCIFPDFIVAENLMVPVLALGRCGSCWSKEWIGVLFPPLTPL